MLTFSDIVQPTEWVKSFTGDGLPPGPNVDYHTGVVMAKNWYTGNFEYLMEAYREFGPVFTTRVMGVKNVWLIGAEANQYMYVDGWRDFYWWGESMEGHLKGLIGEGLLTSVDETHDKFRKLLDPVFSKTNLQRYVNSMIEVTESELDDLEDGDSFDFYDWIYDVALLNATACFMGMDPESINTRELHENFDKCVQYYQNPIFAQVLRGPFTPYRRFRNAKETIDDVLYDEIESRQLNGGGTGDNILDRLIEAEEDGQTFSDEEIHDQILNLYWAGHDTTISAISWLVMLLGKYPDAYEAVKTELDERVGDQPVEADEIIDGLPYLEMVMDETLRLYPPAWIANRKARNEFEMHGHTIPEGTECTFSSLVTHRLSHLFEDPEAFKPRRMEPEKKREFPPGAYIPFARGPRTCIGMNFAKYEIKLVVASLLRRFDFELVPGQTFQGYPVATLTPDGVDITLEKRNNPVATSGVDRPDSPGDVTGDPDDDSTGSGESECPVH